MSHHRYDQLSNVLDPLYIKSRERLVSNVIAVSLRVVRWEKEKERRKDVPRAVRKPISSVLRKLLWSC